MVLPAQRRARSPPYTGRVFKEKPSSWGYGVSTAQHQRRQDSVLAALRSLSEQGLTAMGVLAFLHHRRVVPLMERPLCIFEMTEEADPIALARSRMLPTPSGGRMRSPGRGAPSTPGCRRIRTGPRGTSRCSPPARW
jgi:hypothetical protein